MVAGLYPGRPDGKPTSLDRCARGTSSVVRVGFRGVDPTVERRICAPAGAVWRILVDLDYWPRWGPTVSGADTDGDVPLGLGARGRVHTPVGVSLPFTVHEYVEGGEWGWRVAGVAATRHGVRPDGDGCRAWMSAPWWAPGYLPVLAVALRRIDQLASRPEA